MSTRAPLYTRCPLCRALVLEVRWDWQDGILIGTPRLDPVGLDREQITACILTGVPLWQLQRRLDHTWTTSRRTRWWPTRPVPGHTAPEHKCHRVWNSFPVDLTPAEAITPTECPF